MSDSDWAHQDELQTLKLENNMLRQAIEHSPLPCSVYDADGYLVVWNEAYVDLHPEAFDERAQSNSDERLNYKDVIRPQLKTLVAEDKLEAALEERLQAHNDPAGDVFEREYSSVGWIRGHKYHLPSGGVVGMSVNITELKERERDLALAKEQAEAAEQSKSEFLANMSHEIRTPMNGVLGMAELLCNTNLDQKQKTFADIIHKSGSALLTIINDILDFSKLDAGQLKLIPEPFNLGEAIEDVATLVATRASEKNIELIVRIDPSLPLAFVGDVGRIRQIVTNLMGNAVKFTEQGHVLVEVTGHVSASSEHLSSYRLRCSVQDTGTGIPADLVEKMFDKFSQVDTTSTRRYEGTGLGLSICKSLVEIMDGQICATSELGVGSTFWFEIELALAEVPADNNRPIHDLNGAQILVVDDNAINRQILNEQLRNWRAEPAFATSGQEALTILEAAGRMNIQIDAIVLDYHMPEMNGGEVARKLKQNDVIRDVPIVLLTSMDVGEEAEDLNDLKIAHHLMKPARSTLLLSALGSAVSTNRLSS